LLNEIDREVLEEVLRQQKENNDKLAAEALLAEQAAADPNKPSILDGNTTNPLNLTEQDLLNSYKKSKIQASERA
jgi:hypothetical protein